MTNKENTKKTKIPPLRNDQTINWKLFKNDENYYYELIINNQFINKKNID